MFRCCTLRHIDSVMGLDLPVAIALSVTVIAVCIILGVSMPFFYQFDFFWAKKDFMDLIKFVMFTLVSRDCVPFCKYIKLHKYPDNQGTYDKLNQI